MIQISGLDNRLDQIDSKLSRIEKALQSLEKEDQKVDQKQVEFLTKKEGAKLLSCSISTIDNYRRKGIFKRHYVGNAVRFKKSELIAAIVLMNHKKKSR